MKETASSGECCFHIMGIPRITTKCMRYRIQKGICFCSSDYLVSVVVVILWMLVSKWSSLLSTSTSHLYILQLNLRRIETETLYSGAGLEPGSPALRSGALIIELSRTSTNPWQNFPFIVSLSFLVLYSNWQLKLTIEALRSRSWSRYRHVFP